MYAKDVNFYVVARMVSKKWKRSQILSSKLPNNKNRHKVERNCTFGEKRSDAIPPT